MEQTLFILGLNHRTAPVAVRERLGVCRRRNPPGARRGSRAASPSIARGRVAFDLQSGRGGRCDRGPGGSRRRVTRFLAADRDVERAAFEAALYRYRGARSRAPSVPRRREPRLDGGGRAANPWPAQSSPTRRRLRPAPPAWCSIARSIAPSRSPSGSGAGHPYRARRGLGQFGGGGAGAADLRHGSKTRP